MGTLEELKAAGLHPSYARTVGIAVDHRRRNRCEESLKANVARLEAYKTNLVILKKGDEAPADVVTNVVQPLPPKTHQVVTEAITDEMKDYKAFTTMRVARQESKVQGYRVSVENRKKKD